MTTKPNILLITTDQQRFDHLGIKGLKGIDTPNLDRLAREGLAFDRAYTTSPTCTPARVSILTGQYPSVHGAYTIGASADLDRDYTIAAWLKRADYRTALLGKAHFVARKHEHQHVAGVDSPPDPAFFRDFDGPYMGFDHVRVSIGHTTNAVPDMHYRCWLEDQGVDYTPWFPQMTGTYDQFAPGVWNIPEQYHDTSWVAQNTMDWIDRHAQDDMPWFCWTSFQDPHEPFVCPEPWYSQVRVDEMELYEDYRPGEFDDKPEFYNRAYQGRQDSNGGGFAGDWSMFNDGKGVPCCYRIAGLDNAEARKKALQTPQAAPAQ